MATQIRKDLTHLCRELKAPSLLASFERLAKRGRDETWSYEEFLAACLEREVASRQSHGGENRIKAAHFPQTKTLEDFDFSNQRSFRKEVVARLGTLDLLRQRTTSSFSVRREREKSHLAIAVGIRACQTGPPVAFATAAAWVDRLGEGHAQPRLHDELIKLGWSPLLVIDEVGYIPFEAEAANPVVPARVVSL